MARREITIETNLTATHLRAAAKRENNRRAALRMLAIANELDGYDRDEAARLAGMSDQSLRDAIKRFNAEGLDGLFDRPRAGRPRNLDQSQDEEIKAAILNGPDIENDGRSAFTLDDVRSMIVERFGVEFHTNYMGRLMRRLDLSRQKARPCHPKKDPTAEAVFKKRPTTVKENCRYTPDAK